MNESFNMRKWAKVKTVHEQFCLPAWGIFLQVDDSYRWMVPYYITYYVVYWSKGWPQRIDIKLQLALLIMHSSLRSLNFRLIWFDLVNIHQSNYSACDIFSLENNYLLFINNSTTIKYNLYSSVCIVFLEFCQLAKKSKWEK